MVTLISILLKLEKPTRARYVAIALDLFMMALTLILRLTVGKAPLHLNRIVDELGENDDKRYLFYILIVIMANSVQFVLTKLLLQKSRLSIVTFAVWVYLFGTLGSFALYIGECLWRGRNTLDDMPHMLSLVEDVIMVFLFSCLNEVANYILLLYFIRKTLVTKASVYGIVGSIFIIFVSIFSWKIRQPLLWAEIVVFLTSYVIIFLTKRREKRVNKKKAVQIRYLADMREDERAAMVSHKHYGRTEVYEEHFEQREDGAWDHPQMLKDFALPRAQLTSRKTYLAGLDHLNLDLTRLNEMTVASEVEKSYDEH